MNAAFTRGRAAGRSLLALGLALLLFTVARVHAHTMPFSVVLLDFQHDAVGADLILPLQELELGFKQPLLADPPGVVPKYGPALRRNSSRSSRPSPSAIR